MNYVDYTVVRLHGIIIATWYKYSNYGTFNVSKLIKQQAISW